MIEKCLGICFAKLKSKKEKKIEDIVVNILKVILNENVFSLT